MIFSTFGTITNPFGTLGVNPASDYVASTQGEGLVRLANNLIKLGIVLGGIYAFANIIVAGYMFLSSSESKEVAKAWQKIWQSMIGLLIMAGSFVLAAIFGWIIFGDSTALLQPKLYGP
mgnify:CR=1 FL=1